MYIQKLVDACLWSQMNTSFDLIAFPCITNGLDNSHSGSQDVFPPGCDRNSLSLLPLSSRRKKETIDAVVL